MAGVRAFWSVVGALLSWSSGAWALSPQEISDMAQARVALVSVRDGRGNQTGTGSGFVISSSGRFATNFHVIDDASELVAVFPDGREVRATGVWVHDAALDLAVLQLEPGNYEPFVLANEPAVGGEHITLIGYPRGMGPAVTTGIVSALQREGLKEDVLGEELPGWALRITAPSEPGSSGSPIVRETGQVVGVMVGHTNMFEGVRFGIPIARLQRLLAEAPSQPQELTHVTGGRSVVKNLTISGALIAALALLWIVGAQLHQRRQKPVGLRR